MPVLLGVPLPLHHHGGHAVDPRETPITGPFSHWEKVPRRGG